jgi:hypothetical protein
MLLSGHGSKFGLYPLVVLQSGLEMIGSVKFLSSMLMH